MESSWYTYAIYTIIIFILLYFYNKKNIKYWKNRGVAEISPMPFFGNFINYFLMKVSPGLLIKSFYDESENQPYVGFYSFNKPCLLLRDLKIIKKIFIRDFMSFSDKFMRSSENDLLSNQSLPFLKNPHWKLWRSKLSPAFSPGKLRNAFRDLQETTIDLDNYLESLDLKGSGKTIDVKELCAIYTTDLAGLTSFGVKLNSFNSKTEFRKFGKQMFGDYNWRRTIELTSIFLASQFTTFFDFRFFEKKSGEFFAKEFEKILKERESSEIKRGDLSDLLIQIKKSDETISFSEILSQAIVFFTAGFDTISTVMSSVLYELAKNLDIQTKLRNTLTDAMENGEITYQMVTTLPYLEMVVLETLRLHSTVPTIDRIATKDYKIEETELTIEKGTPIFISVYGLHKDERYFNNPEAFDPENFSESHQGSKNPAYMPFGIGPRSCIANRQGLMQVKYGVAYLISKFEVTLTENNSDEVDSRVYFTAGKKNNFLNVRKIPI